MRSQRKATFVFVAILLLFLLSFVSAELIKRDPQAPGAGGAPPDGGKAAPPDGGKAAPPDAGGKAAPPDAGGKAAPPDAGGKAAPPDAGGKAAPPAGGNAAPPAGGNAAPPAGGNAAPPAGGNAAPPAGGKAAAPPAGGNAAPPPTGGDTIPPAGGNNTNTTYVDPQTPTVQVKMTEPKSAKNVLYKIGSNITFKWEYDSNFAISPKSVSVLAQAEIDVKNFYTIAKNMTVNTTQEAIWVTAKEPSLPMTKYKLWIFDDIGISAPPRPGGLQTFSTLEFGLYNSQTTDSCPSCNPNSAISILIIPLSTICLTSLITIISFNFISI